MKKGNKVEGIVLKDQHKKEIDLSSLTGSRVLLSFHPLAWTKVCACQMKDLEKHQASFEKHQTVALGINVDPIPSKRAWAEELEIEKTSLLSDFWPHGEVARKLGIFREENGFSERANIILDEKGVIIFKKIYELTELPDIEEVLSLLAARD